MATKCAQHAQITRLVISVGREDKQCFGSCSDPCKCKACNSDTWAISGWYHIIFLTPSKVKLLYKAWKNSLNKHNIFKLFFYLSISKYVLQKINKAGLLNVVFEILLVCWYMLFVFTVFIMYFLLLYYFVFSF